MKLKLTTTTGKSMRNTAGGRQQEQINMKRVKRKLEALVSVDSLTGVANRRGL